VYNKTLFQQAGVPAPTEAWTWNDVIEAGRRLTDEGANRWGVGNILPHWSRWSWVVAENDGKLISDDGKHSLLTTPPVVEAVQLQVDLIHRHRVAPLPTFTGSFARGNYATTYSGVPKANVVAVGSQFEWDVMYVPKWPRTGKRVLRIDDQANWMTAQGKQRGHGDQAYELLRWMSAGEPAQRLVAELGPCYPVLKKVAQQPPYGAPPPASIAILAEHTQKWPAGDPVFLYSELWYRAVTAALTPAYTGERSVPEALDAANRAGDGILAQGYEGVK
jgi:multiple sugar transport system substrate-binding protein